MDTYDWLMLILAFIALVLALINLGATVIGTHFLASDEKQSKEEEEILIDD